MRATFAAPVDLSLVAPFGEMLTAESSRIEMLEPRASVPALVRALDALPLADLTIEPMSLEDAFLEHYR